MGSFRAGITTVGCLFRKLRVEIEGKVGGEGEMGAGEGYLRPSAAGGQGATHKYKLVVADLDQPAIIKCGKL